MSLHSILSLCKNDIEIVNKHIAEQMCSDIPLVEEITQYIIDAGGKRLRPILCILVAKALDYSENLDTLLAAVIESLHTATLLHDDVIDGADQRRGRPTANEHWGNANTILVGDFIYSRAFQMIVQLNDQDITSALAQATSQIAEGEVQQLVNTGRVDLSQDEYIETITRKTAVLFAVAAKCSGILAGQNTQELDALYAYGKNLGIVFQIIDDVLDYEGDPELTGKNIGTDLSEGKMTLPLIFAREQANEQQLKIIEQAISKQDASLSKEIMGMVKAGDVIERTLAAAQHYADIAKSSLNHIPESQHKQALIDLVDISVNRSA